MLDWQLERQKIEKMKVTVNILPFFLEHLHTKPPILTEGKKYFAEEYLPLKVKTQKVIKRISEVVTDNEVDEGEALKKETVRLFLYNKAMWKKYVNIELEEGEA